MEVRRPRAQKGLRLQQKGKAPSLVKSHVCGLLQEMPESQRADKQTRRFVKQGDSYGRECKDRTGPQRRATASDHGRVYQVWGEHEAFELSHEASSGASNDGPSRDPTWAN